MNLSWSKEFVNTSLVCDGSSYCACNLANLSYLYSNLTECFSDYVCEYDFSKQEFCSGNGYCNFTNATCMCEDGFGGNDCSSKYELFIVSGVITYGLIVLASILAIVCLFLMLWLYRYRTVSDVKAMSVTFTQLTLIGCLLICLHVIVLGSGFNDINCVLLEWFAFIGVCLLLGCALLKAFRIACIFSSQSFSPSSLTDKVLLRYLGIFMIIDVILLTIYTIFNDIEHGSYDRYVIDETDSNNIEYWIERRCSSQPLTLLSYYLLVAWQCILLAFCLKYGNKTSSASNIFKETTCIYLGSNISLIFFILFGVFVLFTTNLQFQIAVRGFGSLFVVFLCIILLFYPKLKSVYFPPIVDEDGLTSDLRDLQKQYEVNLKDRSGKELLLVLDSLVAELTSRLEMKMLRLEFNSIDMVKIQKLMEKLEQHSPHPDIDDTKQNKQYKQQTSISNLETAINDSNDR